jgi:DNA-binding GntR family transcriptional regulator
VLENEGLVKQTARLGAVVAPMGLQDVYEIVTLRDTLEEMAVRLGVPVHSEARLESLRSAIETLERNAVAVGGEDSASHDSYGFHLALVGLSGHERLEAAYRSMALQMLRYMNLNRRARAGHETLVDRAARHRALFELVAAGDADAVLDALQGDESLSFVREFGPTLERGSAQADLWLAGVLARGTPTGGPTP